MTENVTRRLAEILWKLYRRPYPAKPWAKGSDLFWNDPAFSERILREHLDDSHGAASRTLAERTAQIEWLWQQLNLQPEQHLFDITCGPGLYAVEFAQRGCAVTGIDFSPTSVAYAKDLAVIENVADRCNFVEQDVRQMNYGGANFDAAILLYGQLAVFKPQEAQELLYKIAQSLRPGGRVCIELLNQEHVDKATSSWWFTDDTGLWGDRPFLHLGERFWHEEQQVSVERYHIIHLETGELTQMVLTDQTYTVETMASMLRQAGFGAVEAFPGWDGLPLPDAEEWVAYVARR